MNAVERINLFIKGFTNLAMVVLVVIVFAQVFSRYILQHSLPWSEELARYIMVWLTFLGAALAVNRGAHPRVEAFLSFIPEKPRKLIEVLGFIAAGLFYLMLLYYGYLFSVANFGQPSPVLRIPMGYIFMVIPMSGLFLFINNCVRIYWLLKGGTE